MKRDRNSGLKVGKVPAYDNPEVLALREKRRKEGHVKSLRLEAVRRIRGVFYGIPESFPHIKKRIASGVHSKKDAIELSRFILEEFNQWRSFHGVKTESTQLLNFAEDPDVTDEMISEAFNLFEIEKILKQ